jgi:CarD family transcriptional regulator
MSGPVISTPAAKKLVFKVGELVVYPAHGVGRISMIEEQEIAGAKLELYIVDFEKEKLRLKVPTGRAEQKGMRRLSDKTQVESALKVLKGRARIKRTMWSRRAQEYDAKINSGDIMAVAEVVRDLYRSERQPEQSYSERQLFEQALDRMAREIAAVRKMDDDQAIKELEDYLSKNAKRARRLQAKRQMTTFPPRKPHNRHIETPQEGPAPNAGPFHFGGPPFPNQGPSARTRGEGPVAQLDRASVS